MFPWHIVSWRLKPCVYDHVPFFCPSPWGSFYVIKWKYFPRYWPFVRRIHRSLVTSPHKGQWRGALMFSLICVWINTWVNNRDTGDLRRYRAHYDVIVMFIHCHRSHYTVGPVPMKQPEEYKLIYHTDPAQSRITTTTKHSTLKPCTHSMGYSLYNGAWLSFSR